LVEICSDKDEEKLIENLIHSFIKNLNDVEYANSILRTLRYQNPYSYHRKLNDWIPEEVLPQMIKSANFPFAISEYLTKIDMK
jgi:hypothetical protein